nr:hypothetical protein CFP56_42000 [Quercus suber]
MEISSMDDVVSLPHGWTSNLISLESLYIWRCKELNLGSDVDNMEWRHLNRLSHLEFHSLPKLNSLPAGLQHVTTLKMLTISHFVPSYGKDVKRKPVRIGTRLHISLPLIFDESLWSTKARSIWSAVRIISFTRRLWQQVLEENLVYLHLVF